MLLKQCCYFVAVSPVVTENIPAKKDKNTQQKEKKQRKKHLSNLSKTATWFMHLRGHSNVYPYLFSQNLPTNYCPLFSG